MKHIVFVLNKYYPNPSPNGYCVKKIINELMDGDEGGKQVKMNITRDVIKKYEKLASKN